jgi:hypothetical protein
MIGMVVYGYNNNNHNHHHRLRDIPITIGREYTYTANEVTTTARRGRRNVAYFWNTKICPSFMMQRQSTLNAISDSNTNFDMTTTSTSNCNSTTATKTHQQHGNQKEDTSINISTTNNTNNILHNTLQEQQQEQQRPKSNTSNILQLQVDNRSHQVVLTIAIEYL